MSRIAGLRVRDIQFPTLTTPSTPWGSSIEWSNYVQAFTYLPFARFILNGVFVAAVGTFRDGGVVRAVGVGSNSVDALSAAIKTGLCDVVMLAGRNKTMPTVRVPVSVGARRSRTH